MLEPTYTTPTGETCPECGCELLGQDHPDGAIYDTDECRCPECLFVGYLTVYEDGEIGLQDGD